MHIVIIKDTSIKPFDSGFFIYPNLVAKLASAPILHAYQAQLYIVFGV